MAENRIPKIKLSESEQNRLKTRLDDMITLAEDFRSSSKWGTLHEQYWNQHLCIPRHETRTSPWPGASNLFTPLTQVVDLAVVAQEYDAMLANDPIIKVIPTHDMPPEEAEALSDYYGNFFWREKVNIRYLGSDWLLDNTVDGTSAVKVRQVTDLRVRRKWETRTTVHQEDLTIQYDTGPITEKVPSRMESYIEEVPTIERMDDVAVDVVDLERIYIAPDSGPSLEFPICRWYYQEQFLAWDDLVLRRSNGYDVPDELKAHLNDRELSHKEKAIAKKEGTSETEVEPTVRVCEFYMRWPLPGRFQKQVDGKVENYDQKQGDEDGYMEEVIVSYAPDGRHLMRVVPLERVYPDGRRPHILNHYHRIPRYPYGQGVPSKLKAIQSATNTQHNQMIDLGTLSVIPFFLYNPGSMGPMPDLLGIRPGAGIPTPDPRGAVFPRLQTDIQYFLASINQLQGMAEKATSISDTQLGRNPSTPNAPRTATGMKMQVAAGNIAFGILVAMHAEAFVEMQRRVHALKSRFAPELTAYRSRQNGKLRMGVVPKSAFEKDVDFQFVLNPNRSGEQQINMQLFQLLMSVPYIQQYPRGVRALAKQTYDSIGNQISGGKQNFNEIWPEEQVVKIETQQKQQEAMQQQQVQMQQQQMQQGPPPGQPGQPPMQPPQPGPVMPMPGAAPMQSMMPNMMPEPVLPPLPPLSPESMDPESAPVITPEDEQVQL